MHCPECGEEIADDSRYCRACGAEVNPPEGEEGAPEVEGGTGEESDGRSTFGRVVYWGGRLGQIALVGVAGILVLGAIVGNMNIIAFASIGIFALVLFAVVGVIELLLIRPLS